MLLFYKLYRYKICEQLHESSFQSKFSRNSAMGLFLSWVILKTLKIVSAASLAITFSI